MLRNNHPVKIKLELFDRDVLALVCVLTALGDETNNPKVLEVCKKLKPEFEQALLKQSTLGRINKIADTKK